MERKLYQHIAACLQAMRNCEQSGNTEWLQRHRDTIESLVSNHMPSGSGIDNGTQFDFDASSPNKLVFITAFHHMNDAGMYSGWTDHTVVVTPDLASGYNIRITGRDRNAIKDYLADTFSTCFDLVIDSHKDAAWAA